MSHLCAGTRWTLGEVPTWNHTSAMSSLLNMAAFRSLTEERFACQSWPCVMSFWKGLKWHTRLIIYCQSSVESEAIFDASCLFVTRDIYWWLENCIPREIRYGNEDDTRPLCTCMSSDEHEDIEWWIRELDERLLLLLLTRSWLNVSDGTSWFPISSSRGSIDVPRDTMIQAGKIQYCILKNITPGMRENIIVINTTATPE